MPIYEYICRECGHELEQLQRMSDDALTECPACGQATLKRKVSAAGFRLSGGGWYETDFKSDGRRNLAASEAKSESSESSGKAASKDEGKGAGKAADSKTDKKKSGDTSKSGDSGSKKEGAKKAGKGAASKSSSA